MFEEDHDREVRISRLEKSVETAQKNIRLAVLDGSPASHVSELRRHLDEIETKLAAARALPLEAPAQQRAGDFVNEPRVQRRAIVLGDELLAHSGYRADLPVAR